LCRTAFSRSDSLASRSGLSNKPHAPSMEAAHGSGASRRHAYDPQPAASHERIPGRAQQGRQEAQPAQAAR
jgi:hypothetical protein